MQDLQDAGIANVTLTGSSEILTREPRGEKRPRGDTIISTHDRPPKADMEGKYRGENMREFTTFMTRITIFGVTLTTSSKNVR